jgi:hypothetical protein
LVHFFCILTFLLTGLFAPPPPPPNTSYYTAVSGNWNATSTWVSNAVPGTGYSAHIKHNITLNVDVSGLSTYIDSTKSVATTTSANKSLEVKAPDTLIVRGNLTVYDLTFDNGCYVQVNTGGSIRVYHNLVNKNNSKEIHIDGTILVDGDFDNGNGGSVDGTGSITTIGSYTGSGMTFQYVNSVIPSNTTISRGSLPVELLYFKSTVGKAEIILKWATSSETNNDYFTIEKSLDGQLFSTIANVQGAGNSNNVLYYQFIDENPATGISYYRLRQTDYDGKYEYVGEITCQIYGKDDYSFSFANPIISDKLDIIIKGEAGTINIGIFNYSGQRIFDQSYNLDDNQSLLSIPFTGLRKGYYIMAINTSSGQIYSFPLFNAQD